MPRVKRPSSPQESAYSIRILGRWGGKSSRVRTLLAAACLALFSHSAWSEQRLTALKVDKPPVIDGVTDDPAWERAPAITTRDRVENIDITLKSVYTDEEIFVLVQFPDTTENRKHKALTWNREREEYITGLTREDVFVVKWSLENHPADISISSDEAYKADIWYWKAFRTDPLGYADDKFHIYGPTSLRRSARVLSKMGRTFYLARRGDSGTPAYSPEVYVEFLEEEMPKYKHREPSGSRADIRAKGAWQDNRWTIEFRRKLDTGNVDDVRFDVQQSYQFGVSRHEIAGKRPNPDLEQPYYGSGEIGEKLWLDFASAQR